LTRYSPGTGRPGRLLPLQKDSGRIAKELAQASLTNDPPAAEGAVASTDEVSEEEVSAAIRAWRDRGLYIPPELLSDPAWGMLLSLLHGEIRNERWTMSRLGKAAGVSTAATIRWVTALEIGDLAGRRPNPHDTGNDFVALTPRAGIALRRYFRDGRGKR